jgi:hypothetical protein
MSRKVSLYEKTDLFTFEAFSRIQPDCFFSALKATCCKLMPAEQTLLEQQDMCPSKILMGGRCAG